MARVFVITGPSGVGKGTLIRGLMERLPRARAVGVGDHAAPAPGRARRRRLPLPQPRASSTSVVARGRVRRARRLRRAQLRDAALRARAAALQRGRAGACSRSRSRARARCAPRCPRPCRCSSRRPRWRRCASACSGAGPTTPRRSSAACAVAEQELAAQPEFAHVVVNDELERRHSSELNEIVDGELGCGAAGGRLDRGRAGLAARLHCESPTRKGSPQSDLAPHRPTARAGRLKLRRRDRRRQARAPDQQLLPQPRRGDLRRVPAADDRDASKNYLTIALEEVAAREDEVPLPLGEPGSAAGRRASAPASACPPRAARSRTSRPCRGYCSASAAASPRTRRSSSCAWRPAPATPCASCRRPPAGASSGQASFAALTGAPVLVERVRARPARGAFPDQPAARRTSRSSHLELVANAERVPDRARHRPTRSPSSRPAWPTTCSAAARSPRAARSLVAPAMNSAHVRAPRHPGQPAHAARARRDDRRARQRAARLRRRARRRAPGRARRAARRLRDGDRAQRGQAVGGRDRVAGRARARDRRRHARADRQRALHRQQLLRAHGPRARARGRTRAGRAGHGARRERGAAGARRGAVARDVVSAAELQAGVRAGVPGLRRAADGRRGRRLRARRAGRGQDQEGRARERCSSSSSRPPTCSPSSPRSAASGQTLVGLRRRARRPSGWQAARGKLVAKRLDALVVNDISRADIGFDVGRERGHDPDRRAARTPGAASARLHVPRASKEQVAEAILDAVERAAGQRVKLR